MKRALIVAAALVAIACALPAHAREVWYVAHTAHFTVVSNDGPKQACETARELEQLRAVFTSLLELRVEAGKPLNVIAVRSESSLRRLLPVAKHFRKRIRLAGVIYGTEENDWAVVRRDSKASAHVLYHEYAHLLARLSLGPLPQWLDEGLAEFYGGFRATGDAVYVGELNQDWLSMLQQRHLMPVTELMTVTGDSPVYTAGNDRTFLFYEESAVLTHYLMLGDNGGHRAQLMALQRLREAGYSDEDAVTLVFGAAWRLDLKLQEYTHRVTHPVMWTHAVIPEQAISVRELRPAEADAFLADFLLATNQRKEARAMVEDALRLEPSLGSAHLENGLLLHMDGHGREATGELAEACRLAPTDPLALFRFGAYGFGAGADGHAREESLRAAIRLAPTYAPSYGTLARLLLSEGRSLAEADVLAGEAASLDPDDVPALATQLEIEVRLSCDKAAEQLEERLVRLARVSPPALRVVTRRLESLGNPERAEALARQVWEKDPGNLTAVTTLAGLIARQKRPDEAEAVLRLGLALRPESASLLDNLAYLNAKRGVQLDEALVLIDRALRIKPADPAYQDTKAWVLFRLGRLREAEEWVRKALEDGEDPVQREHLGDILEKQGRVAEAVAAWKAGLESVGADDTEERARLEEKIAKATAAGSPAP